MQMRRIIFALLLSAAVAGSLFAQFQDESLGREAAKLTKQDIPGLETKAESGDSHAALLLGRAYAMGYGPRPSITTAFDWYKKSADAGNPLGQYYVCLMSDQGVGMRAEPETAAQWCQKAADQGLAEAQSMLGVIYSRQRHYPEAEALYRKAAEQGYFTGQWNLAGLYADGHGVPLDHESAYRWLLIARSLRSGSPPVFWIERKKHC